MRLSYWIVVIVKLANNTNITKNVQFFSAQSLAYYSETYNCIVCSTYIPPCIPYDTELYIRGQKDKDRGTNKLTFSLRPSNFKSSYE